MIRQSSAEMQGSLDPPACGGGQYETRSAQGGDRDIVRCRRARDEPMCTEPARDVGSGRQHGPGDPLSTGPATEPETYLKRCRIVFDGGQASGAHDLTGDGYRERRLPGARVGCPPAAVVLNECSTPVRGPSGRTGDGGHDLERVRVADSYGKERDEQPFVNRHQCDSIHAHGRGLDRQPAM
jgi:hypothetical protein